MIRIAYFLAVAAYGVIAGCKAPPVERLDRSEIKTKVGVAVERICALPERDRQAEMEKLKKRTGLELQCAEGRRSDHIK